MRAYRLASRHLDPLSGAGASRHGGRWNSRGTAMVYASAHLSLAVLETLVHVELTRDLPADRRFWEYEVPDEPVAELDVDEIPDDWAFRPHLTRALGDDWVAGGRSLAFLVPSAVVPIERNLLINPDHPGLDRLSLLRSADYRFDPRLSAG